MRWLPNPGLSVALALLWLALNNTLAAGHVVLAAAIGLLAPFVVQPMRESPIAGRSPRIAAALRLMARLGADIVASNLAVARRILFAREESLSPVVVELALRLESPTAASILAGIVTLTPGTLSADLIEGDGFVLQVHALDAPDPDALVRDIRGRYETLLLEMLR
jgi:multicomponent K+:H+ antiporter subunit E